VPGHKPALASCERRAAPRRDAMPKPQARNRTPGRRARRQARIEHPDLGRASSHRALRVSSRRPFACRAAGDGSVEPPALRASSHRAVECRTQSAVSHGPSSRREAPWAASRRRAGSMDVAFGRIAAVGRTAGTGGIAGVRKAVDAVASSDGVPLASRVMLRRRDDWPRPIGSAGNTVGTSGSPLR
jgi:hypothetical protein